MKVINNKENNKGRSENSFMFIKCKIDQLKRPFLIF